MARSTTSTTPVAEAGEERCRVHPGADRRETPTCAEASRCRPRRHRVPRPCGRPGTWSFVRRSDPVPTWRTAVGRGMRSTPSRVTTANDRDLIVAEHVAELGVAGTDRRSRGVQSDSRSILADDHGVAIGAAPNHGGRRSTERRAPSAGRSSKYAPDARAAPPRRPAAATSSRPRRWATVWPIDDVPKPSGETAIEHALGPLDGDVRRTMAPAASTCPTLTPADPRGRASAMPTSARPRAARAPVSCPDARGPRDAAERPRRHRRRSRVGTIALAATRGRCAEGRVVSLVEQAGDPACRRVTELTS